MAHSAFHLLRFVFVLAFLCGVIPERGHENFPLNDCPTNEMDVLCLYVPIQSEYEHIMCRFFMNHLLSFPNNKTTPRVLFAGVNDSFSVYNPNVNVSSWRLHESPELSPYGDGRQGEAQDYTNVNEAIDLKGKFVRRLFSEMGGVRKNVSHIAVVFLRARGLSFDGWKSVPHNVQQPDTDVKIFVVVLAGGGIQADCPSDTLILNTNLDNYHKYLLVQAMCNQCLEGWWKFEHRVGAQSMSCYKLENSGHRSAYTGDRSTCYGINSDLVTVESKSELTFLQSMLHSHFIELRKRSQSSQFPARLYLGMSRNKKYTMDRFRWDLSDKRVSRPIVVNKWLPGKPSGGYGNLCAVWQFDWIQEINNAHNVFSDEGRLVDGWEDVDCGAKSSFILCETPLPRRVKASDKIRISPATNESLSRALNKGGFVKFQNNIVSVSFNYDSNDFRQFLQQAGNETFPVFDCGPDARSPRYISYSLVCNGVNDCNNARDEYGCSKTSSNEWESGSKLCHRIICCNGVCWLQKWVNNGEVDCTVCDDSARDDGSANVSLNMGGYGTCSIYCDDRICVPVSQLNGGHIDCTGLEGPLDRTIGKLVKVDTCHNHYSNIIWVPMCVYVIYIKGAALGCRDMSHLENCSDFECPLGYVKCPSTYCIPQHYVLDREEDCPTGDDERLEYISPCTGNLACWNSKVCIYPDMVCDGRSDCPHKDDEVDCNSPCLEGFRCVSGTITVSGYNKSIRLTRLPEFPYKATYLDLSGLDFRAVIYPGRFGLNAISVVKLSNCGLRYLDVWLIPYFHAPPDVDLSYNRLKVIDGREDVFVMSGSIRRLNLSYNTQLATVKYLLFGRLETLDLSHTIITQIPSTFLKELPSLKNLDLSFTSIRSFEKGLFPSSLNLQTLDLRGLQLDNFYEDFLNGLTVSQDLYTDSFEMCCPQIRGNNILSNNCHAPNVAISSCFDLIGVNVQRVLLWVVAVLAVLGNVTVIVYRVIWDRSVLKTGYGLFVTNLGVSDFIMGVYLFIIAGADYYYRGIYVLYDKTWRESITCRFSGILATLSSEASMIFVFLITLDRFLVMKFPFGQVKLSKINTNIALCLCWLIGFLLALAPALFKFEIFSSNAMCVGLPLTTKRLHGWEYSFGVFIAFNFVLCVVIAVGQRAIFRAMSENRISGVSTSTSPRRAADIMVAKQLSLVALSNFLCWFPVGFMGLLSLTGHEISNDVYAWTTIIVLPINSAANPLLYTIPVLLNKWDKFKFGQFRSKSKEIVIPAITTQSNTEKN